MANKKVLDPHSPPEAQQKGQEEPDYKEMVREIRKIVARFGMGGKLAEQLDQRDFLRGWKEGRLLEDIASRLDTHAKAKENLAKWLRVDGLKRDPQARRLFIESGSTLAFFARELAEHYEELGDSSDRPSVLTNNFLAQLALFGILPVGVTHGMLSDRYLAFLPFGPAQRNEDVDDEVVFSDRLAFGRLTQAVSNCDAIYVTCSTFGLLIGPLVGTRNNALFKYCLFNNQARAPVRLCFVERKLFHKSRYRWAKEHESNGHTEEAVKEHIMANCFMVFDIEGDQVIDGHDLVVDANALIADDIRAAGAPNKRGIRAAPRELMLTRDWNADKSQLASGTQTTWLGYLETQPSERIEVVIGCATTADAKEVYGAVEEANGIMKKLGCSREYVRRKPVNQTVVHLIVTRR